MIQEELSKILAKNPSRANSVQSQSLAELADTRRKQIQNLEKFERLLSNFGSLLEQTEQSWNQKIDLPTAS